jgi:hypothetical protein
MPKCRCAFPGFVGTGARLWYDAHVCVCVCLCPPPPGSNMTFEEPPHWTDEIEIGGLRTALRWRELLLELRALRGKGYDPAIDLLMALIFWSGKDSGACRLVLLHTIVRPFLSVLPFVRQTKRNSLRHVLFASFSWAVATRTSPSLGVRTGRYSRHVFVCEIWDTIVTVASPTPFACSCSSSVWLQCFLIWRRSLPGSPMWICKRWSFLCFRQYS